MNKLPGLSPEKARALILSVGTHRSDRPLSPIEVAEAMEASVTAGATTLVLAEALQLEDATWVTRFRRLLRLPNDVQHLVNWGSSPASVSLTSSTEIARLSSQDDQRFVMNAVVEHNMTSAEVRQIVQVLRRSGKSAGEATAEIIGQRPQVTRRHMLIGAIQSDEMQMTLRCMTQRDRDALLNAALHAHLPDLPAWTGRLGIDHFALSGGEDFAAAVQALPAHFEVVVNTALRKELA